MKLGQSIQINVCQGKTENYAMRIDFGFDLFGDAAFLEAETNFFEGHPYDVTDNRLTIHHHAFKVMNERYGGNTYWTMFDMPIADALGLMNILKNNHWACSAAWVEIAEAWEKLLQTITADLLGITDPIQPLYVNPAQLPLF